MKDLKKENNTTNLNIAKSAIIHKNVQIIGKWEIGENTIIYPNCVIQNSKIGSNCVIKSSYLEHWTIKNIQILI